MTKPATMVAVTEVMATTILRHAYVVDESGMNVRVSCRYCRKTIIDNEFFEREEPPEITHSEDCVARVAQEIMEITNVR